MASADDASLDLAELRALLASATRPHCVALLEQAAAAAERRVAAAVAAAASSSASSSAAAAASSSTSAAAASSSSAAVPTAGLPWTPITRYGFEQDDGFVTVLCWDLPRVGLAKARAHCDFTADSFDLTVPDVPAATEGGRTTSYRLRVLNLDKDIVPAQSSVKVKKNSVELRLKKAGKWDHWMELVSKKSREAKKAGAAGGGADKDPAAGINDMMRSMYEDGDEQTRKIIGEAMLKSREEQAGGGGRKKAKGSSFGGGLGGDFGGLGGGGMDDAFGDSGFADL